MITDHKGRPYALVANVKVGDKLVPDCGFVDEGVECLGEDRVYVVESDPTGRLYVQCAAGIHYIDTPDISNGVQFIGFYEYKEPNREDIETQTTAAVSDNVSSLSEDDKEFIREILRLLPLLLAALFIPKRLNDDDSDVDNRRL